VSLDTRVSVPYDVAVNLSLAPAELAVAVQNWQKVKRIATLVARVVVTVDGEVVDPPLTLVEQIDLATSEAELQALREDGLARREWRGHHTIRARERLETLSSKG